MKYLEQYERMLRWYERFKSTDSGRTHNQNSDYYKDEIYAFFVTCYHLRDWIQRDKTVKIKNKDKILKDYVEHSKFMRVCHDICIGHKHLEIDKPKHDKRTKIDSTQHSLCIGGEAIIYKAKYFISDSKNRYDAFYVATNCLIEWNNFIKKYKLLLFKPD